MSKAREIAQIRAELARIADDSPPGVVHKHMRDAIASLAYALASIRQDVSDQARFDQETEERNK